MYHAVKLWFTFKLLLLLATVFAGWLLQLQHSLPNMLATTLVLHEAISMEILQSSNMLCIAHLSDFEISWHR
jgi:hypothetical protein